MGPVSVSVAIPVGLLLQKRQTQLEIRSPFLKIYRKYICISPHFFPSISNVRVFFEREILNSVFFGSPFLDLSKLFIFRADNNSILFPGVCESIKHPVTKEILLDFINKHRFRPEHHHHEHHHHEHQHAVSNTQRM